MGEEAEQAGLRPSPSVGLSPSVCLRGRVDRSKREETGLSSVAGGSPPSPSPRARKTKHEAAARLEVRQVPEIAQPKDAPDRVALTILAILVVAITASTGVAVAVAAAALVVVVVVAVAVAAAAAAAAAAALVVIVAALVIATPAAQQRRHVDRAGGEVSHDEPQARRVHVRERDLRVVRRGARRARTRARRDIVVAGKRVGKEGRRGGVGVGSGASR